MFEEIKIFNLQTNLKILDFSDKNSDQNLMLKIPNLSVIHLLLKPCLPKVMFGKKRKERLWCEHCKRSATSKILDRNYMVNQLIGNQTALLLTGKDTTT